jgi:hypothetical protein
MSKVTSHTLRHYDEIGLLPPAWVGGNGYVSAKSMEHWFEGFDSAKQAELQEEARQRWGAERVDAANATVAGNSKEWRQSQSQQWAGQLDALVALIDTGHEPGDAEVLDALDGHHRWLSGYWTPNRESYTGLGDLYADDPRFRANFDRTDPRLAEFMRAAMAAYARARL